MSRVIIKIHGDVTLQGSTLHVHSVVDKAGMIDVDNVEAEVGAKGALD